MISWEFPLQRLFLSELLALRVDLRHPLTEPLHPGLEFLLINQALCVAINETSQSLLKLAALALQDSPLLVMLPGHLRGGGGGTPGLTAPDAPAGRRLRATRRVRGDPCALAIRTEALAPKTIRIGSETPVIRVGALPTFPRMGLSGLP